MLLGPFRLLHCNSSRFRPRLTLHGIFPADAICGFYCAALGPVSLLVDLGRRLLHLANRRPWQRCFRSVGNVSILPKRQWSSADAGSITRTGGNRNAAAWPLVGGATRLRPGSHRRNPRRGQQKLFRPLRGIHARSTHSESPVFATNARIAVFLYEQPFYCNCVDGLGFLVPTPSRRLQAEHPFMDLITFRCVFGYKATAN